MVSHPAAIASAHKRLSSVKSEPMSTPSAQKLSPRRLQMVQVDVFTDRVLTGNSLAVFLDGRGLSTDEMQALAREMNLSETTFILPADSAKQDPAAEPAVHRPALHNEDRGIRVRIFTVQEELPFAGHPTLGTAFVLRNQSVASTPPDEIRLHLNVGTVPVRFSQPPSQPLFGEMTQQNPVFGAIHDAAAVARLTGLTAADFDDSAPIQTVSTGVPFTIAPLPPSRLCKTSSSTSKELPNISLAPAESFSTSSPAKPSTPKPASTPA